MASLNVPYQGQRDEEIISNTTSEDEIELKSNFNRVKTSTKAISNSSSADSGENGHPGSPTGTSTADAPKPSSMNKRRYLNEIDSWGPADINEVRGSRRRIKTNRYDFEDSNNTEERLVQQAMKNSLVETKKIEFKAPSAPTYHPTVEEFRDPLQYIRSIQPEAEKYGICKIVPPPEWKPPCQVNMESPVRFPTKLQRIDTLQEGIPFDDGRSHTLASYKEAADQFYKEWVSKYYTETPNIDQLSKEYWDIVETRKREVAVEYGNDLDTNTVGSGFLRKGQAAEETEAPLFSPDYYRTAGWNLNNLPSVDNSVLKHIQTPINGINVPWLYAGMLFSTFCWHNEDNYLYSINYHHFGKEKQWYGVPGASAKQFEKTSKDFLLVSFKMNPDLLHHLTTQISPSLLYANDIPVYSIVHTPGTFVVTFPQAYHSGFSYGFNVGEAVNFATLDWLPFGFDSDERYRTFGRPAVFSMVRLLFTLLHHNAYVNAKNTELMNFARKILDEELAARPFLFGLGVRSVSHLVKMPPNTFEKLDKTAMDYDDRRVCCVCKCVCVFSAVACECNNSRVSCTRHEQFMCKCIKSKKFLLEWASMEDLKGMLSSLSRFKTHSVRSIRGGHSAEDRGSG